MFFKCGVSTIITDKNTIKKILITLAFFIFLTFVSHAQWQQTYGPCGGSLNCLVINGSNIYTGTNGGGVFRSSNSGSSWIPINYGITNLWVQALAVTGNNLFAGTYGGGVFMSSNNGNNWVSVDSDLINLNVVSLDTCGGFLYAGTRSSGVWKYLLC